MSPRGEVGEGEIRAKSAYNKTLVRQMSARSHLSLHEDVRGRSFHGILSLRTALQVSPGLLLRLCSNRNRPIDSIDDVHCGESWMRTSARPDLYSRGRDSRDEYSDEGRPPVTCQASIRLAGETEGGGFVAGPSALSLESLLTTSFHQAPTASLRSWHSHLPIG
jgi:hypothetical protein